MTQADFLAMFERLLPPSYLQPLRDVGPGYELLQAYAKLGERLSQAVKRDEDDQFILTAGDAGFASVRLRISRTAAVTPAVIIKKGSVVATTETDPNVGWADDADAGVFYDRRQGGLRYVLDGDVEFAPGDSANPSFFKGKAWHLTTNPITATAVDADWTYNLPGPFVDHEGNTIEGDICKLAVPLLADPAAPDVLCWIDSVWTVKQDSAATGGRPAALNALGTDMDIRRLDGETAAQYRVRLRQIPDVITPCAIVRLLDLMMAPWGGSAKLVEPWSKHFHGAWDGPSIDIPDPSDPLHPLYVAGLFVWDDTRTVSPDPSTQDPAFFGRWLDESTEKMCIVITVPPLGAVTAYGGVWDEPAASAAAAVTPGGTGARALAVWDVPEFMFGTLGPSWAWDGPDTGAAAVYKGIYDAVCAAKMAGINCIEWLRGQ
ncbi:MAG: hypothetical protein WC700_08925 [Gemmatimonadaceae bacterium]|jgi:hypothetical protein